MIEIESIEPEIVDSEPSPKRQKPLKSSPAKSIDRTKLARTTEYRNLEPIERLQNLPRGSVLDVSRALKLRLQGNTNEEIASIFGVSESTIQGALKHFDFIQTDKHSVQAYVDNELEVFDLIRSLASTALVEQLSNPERREKLDIMRLNSLLGTVFDKMRLLRGQSTSNIAALSKLVLDAHGKRSGQSTDNPSE
jgi:hypothetical protein